MPDSESALVVTGPWGGFAAAEYARFQFPGEAGAQWWLDPFAFFRDALGVGDWPRPDTTTLYGRVLAAETESALIFGLLETRARASDSSAALAMTLTQFLMKRSRRGFTEFVKELKSEAAPAPPEEGKVADAYVLEYVSFQEKAIRTHFGTTVPALGAQWKEHVVGTGKRLEKEMEEAAAG